MTHSRLFHFSAYLATLFALTNCSGSSTPSTSTNATGGNSPSSSSTGGATTSANPTGGANSAGGGNATGGASSAGGATTASTSPTGGAATAGGSNSTSATGGSTNASTKPTGGSNGTGGSGATGGSKPTGGSNGTGGTGVTGGSKPTGGSGTAGGSGNTGGASTTGGSATAGGTNAATTDCKGQALAKPGDSTSTNGAYLNLGDMRLIDNMWGSKELSCTSTAMTVHANADKSLSWDFNRPHCDSAYSGAHPDYPEIEFGVAPFGTGTYANLLTTPSCPSTALLPLQVKDITSASINFTNYSISLSNADITSCGETYSSTGALQSWTCSFNLDWEFWLSQDNPNTNPNPTVVAEVIGFWGWEKGRWPCDKTLTAPNFTAGDTTYKICHQSDQWHTTSPPQWSYYQFWDTTGPKTSFTGKIDIRAVLDWLKSNYGSKINDNLWLTRIEVGTEIDDNTVGTTKLNNVAFEVNGTSKTPQFGQ